MANGGPLPYSGLVVVNGKSAKLEMFISGKRSSIPDGVKPVNLPEYRPDRNKQVVITF